MTEATPTLTRSRLRCPSVTLRCSHLHAGKTFDWNYGRCKQEHRRENCRWHCQFGGGGGSCDSHCQSGGQAFYCVNSYSTAEMFVFSSTSPTASFDGANAAHLSTSNRM